MWPISTFVCDSPLVKRFSSVRLSYGQKLGLLATVPLIVAVALIAILVTDQSRQLAEREIAALETQLIEAKKKELRNYVTLARNAFFFIYGNAQPDDAAAKLAVAQILAAMIYGNEGFYFVYDYDGTNIVSPRQTELIGLNWAGQTDPNGVPITDELIRIARSGAGYHSYLWPKPSTGEMAEMVTYVTGLHSWHWALGTGVFIDDVLHTVATARAGVEKRIAQTFVQIGAITAVSLFLVFLSGLFINIRERRLADARLKHLTQRIVDTQEEERSRVARELHDSISQILIGARYALELTRRRLRLGDERVSDSLDRGIDNLSGAIQEVRRISRDLRPSVLDDLGLGPALHALSDEFSMRTGIICDFETVVFSNRLSQDAKTALYRIAQESLTNIARHSGARHVTLRLFGHRRGGTLRIQDDGCGIDPTRPQRSGIGIGLRNMQERIEQLGGTLRIQSSASGTMIEANVPLTHLLPPSQAPKAAA